MCDGREDLFQRVMGRGYDSLEDARFPIHTSQGNLAFWKVKKEASLWTLSNEKRGFYTLEMLELQLSMYTQVVVRFRNTYMGIACNLNVISTSSNKLHYLVFFSSLCTIRNKLLLLNTPTTL